MSASLLVIACGAIARELVLIQKLNGWDHIEFQCLPAQLHNTPERIPGAVRDMIESGRERYDSIFVGYADCGTGGLLDAELAGHGIERIPGAHCYEFFAGSTAFGKMAEAELGTFYLTDFLTRHFDRLIKQGLGLDRHPELMPAYFGNYRRLVYLSQTESMQLDAEARAHAQYLGLEYCHRHTGLQHMQHDIGEQIVQWRK